MADMQAPPVLFCARLGAAGCGPPALSALHEPPAPQEQSRLFRQPWPRHQGQVAAERLAPDAAHHAPRGRHPASPRRSSQVPARRHGQRHHPGRGAGADRDHRLPRLSAGVWAIGRTRAPGMFVARLAAKLKARGGELVELDTRTLCLSQVCTGAARKRKSPSVGRDARAFINAPAASARPTGINTQPSSPHAWRAKGSMYARSTRSGRDYSPTPRT
jgi:hypothetical protein